MKTYQHKHLFFSFIAPTCESNPCDANAICNDTDVFYTCTCQSGYFGNGLTCEGMHLECFYPRVLFFLHVALFSDDLNDSLKQSNVI